MTRDLALLFSDVVDSTQLGERLGDAAMGRLWAAHDHAARELMRHWRATEVGRSDGFFLLFDEAAQAVGYALAYHRALASLSVPLRARVGVHVGPVSLRENPVDDKARGATPFEVDGLALPAAARVMSAAAGGQTLLSAAAMQALNPKPLRSVSHGHWRLKGLAEPMELFEVGDGAAPFEPPADSAKAYRVVLAGSLWIPARELPHNLPAERDAFVGRGEALRALAEQFDAGARLVTVVGLGGIGKTRLSQRYARAWLGDYPGGAWFCDLAPARAVDGIVHAVAQGLNVPLGRADPVQQLGAAIAGRGSCLVILDNFEQVARHAEATLGVWLERAPEARFIATSREVLGLVGERVMVLEPLASTEAVAMFRLRVRAVGVRGEFAADDEGALVPLMELLDRLPLAIELAAARARLMTPRALLERMRDRFALLSSRAGRRDRQATMRATLDWSWELLSPVEQLALAQLSVFEGGFTLQAAEAVLDLLPHRGAPAIVNVLQALLEKSLLRESAGRRFDLLGAVQDYAAEHLRRPQTSSRHGAYFAALAAGAPAAALTLELDNLVAATRRAAFAEQPEVAIGALFGAWAALKLRGPFRVVVELARTVRAMPGLAGAAAARADWVMGWALKACGDSAQAERFLLSSLAAAREAGDGHCERQVLMYLGEVHAHGRMDEARAEFEAALALAREAADAALECECCNGLGSLELNLGRLDEARIHYDAALHTARHAQDRRWEGGSLGNLGALFTVQGRLAEAEDCYRQALAITRELGDRQWEGNSLGNLGLLQHMQGRDEEAAAALAEALCAARSLGHVRLECIVLCNLGIVVQALRDPQAASGHFEAALNVARGLADHRLQGQVLGYLGLLLAQQGHVAEGRAALRDGEAHLRQVSDRLSLALLHCSRAQCEYLGGDANAGNHALAAAEALAVEVGAEPAAELQKALDDARALKPR